MGEDKYPTRLTEAYDMMLHRKSTERAAGRSQTVDHYINMILLQHEDD